MGKQKSRPKYVHDGEQHLIAKTCRQWTIVHTHSSSRHPKRLSSDPST